MISAIQNKDVYEIRFKYDPVVLEYVHAVPGRIWNPDDKFWTIPVDKLGFFLNQIRGTSYERDLQVVTEDELDFSIQEATKFKPYIPDIDISDVPIYVEEGSTLFKHQEDCLKFSIGRKHKGNFSGFILADSPGLGKSLEVINLALFKKQYESAKHCLIITCMNTAKYNWKDDIEKHTNGEYEGYLLGSRYQKRKKSVKLNGTGQDKFQDLDLMKKFGDPSSSDLPYFIILNIEALRTKTKERTRTKKEAFIVTNKIIELIKSGEINMIAIDEIHTNASPTSEQGKQLLRIKTETGSLCEWIPMTGTPIVNKPTDVFLPLRLVDGHKENSNFQWKKKYCIFGTYGSTNILGYKNIQHLKSILEPNMLRRRKSEVLDLPPKIQKIEYVDNTKYQQKLYDMFADEVLENQEEVRKSLNPLTKFYKLRQVNGCPEVVDESVDPRASDYLTKNAKMVRLLELVSDILSDEDEKVVILSNWVEPLRSIYRQVTKLGYTACAYIGSMDDEKQEANKKRFIEDKNCRIFLGTIKALGGSHTLTVSSNVIFYDLPWNPAVKEQSEDRCHRVGTTGTVNVYSIITKNSVDDRVYDMIHRKRGESDYIIDNKLDIKNHPELIPMLVGR